MQWVPSKLRVRWLKRDELGRGSLPKEAAAGDALLPSTTYIQRLRTWVWLPPQLGERVHREQYLQQALQRGLVAQSLRHGGEHSLQVVRAP